MISARAIASSVATSWALSSTTSSARAAGARSSRERHPPHLVDGAGATLRRPRGWPRRLRPGPPQRFRRCHRGAGANAMSAIAIQRDSELLQNIAIGRLLPTRANPRKELRELDDLVASIKRSGVLVPLTVEVFGANYRV